MPIHLPPIVSSNTRYFKDHLGNAIVLTGSHTWANLIDFAGQTDPPTEFDYNDYLDRIVALGHNFFRLWVWEQTKDFTGYTDHWYLNPPFFSRTGTGTANDGKTKFDLTAFNQAYFDRMRSRIVRAWAKGVYVSVMLFNGFSVANKRGTGNNPYAHHPFNTANNSSSIDGDTNDDGDGYEMQQLSISAVTTKQQAYVAKVIDTVNDLPNVLYEICNEAAGGASEVAWVGNFISYIHTYEATKPYQHPVGYTVNYPSGSNADIMASDAEWVSPNDAGADTYKTAPPASDGTKVIIADSDHLWGVGGDRVWVWKSFLRGLGVLFMDVWATEYDPLLAYDPTNANDVALRANLGYVQTYGNQVDLIGGTIQTGGTSPCSTGYCISKAATYYLCYQPSTADFTLDLSGESDTWNITKLNPADGSTNTAQTVTGGATRTITRPTGWTDWVAYVYK